MFASTIAPADFSRCNAGEFSSFIRRGRDGVPAEPPMLLESLMLAETLDLSARIADPEPLSNVNLTQFGLNASPWQEASHLLLAFKCGN